MSKIIKLGSEARTELMKGIDVLADVVVSTLGPNGRNAIYEKDGQIVSTKDGVSLAKVVELKDPTQNFGAQLIKQAAIKTADKAGDGTTTSTLLAREIVKQGLYYLDKNENATQIKRDIDQAVNDVIEHIRENIAEDITSPEQLKQIATISANNDEVVGELITQALEKVGNEGVVHIEESKTGETYLETVEGIQFERGYKSPYFVTDNNTMTAVLKDPYIFITSDRITAAKDLVPVLQYVANNNKSLLVIAEDIDGEALATLLVNKSRGIVSVCAVKAPDYGERRKLILEDIAITTGGTVISKERGMSMDKIQTEWLGTAKTVTVDKETTTIIDGQGDIESINKRIEELQAQIDIAQSAFEREKLQDRLAKLAGGVSIIHVGGNTEAEMKEKKDRVEDALHATKAAIEEGIVPGGGVALFQAKTAISNIDTIGGTIVAKACQKPFEQILLNAGYSQDNIYDAAYSLNHSDQKWNVYNIKTDDMVDAKQSGILDPFKVTRMALLNASSVAGTLLLTEGTIATEPETKSVTPDYSSMMGMM
jgi:chaperonin GroEL